MPGVDPVVADTSPLLNLSLIDRLDLLESQFDVIHVPEAVWHELAAGEEALGDLRGLREQGFLHVVTVDRSELYVEIRQQLDAGETAAITYAIETDASLVLLDERDGRRTARRHGLSVTGVIGILLRGVRNGSVDMPTALGDSRAAGFWISEDLYSEAIQRSENLRE